MRKLGNNLHAVIDLGTVIMIGIVFAALMVFAYIIFTVRDELVPNAPGATTSETYNNSYRSVANVTAGFDTGVNLILIAITIFILALAISALLMLRGSRQ